MGCGDRQTTELSTIFKCLESEVELVKGIVYNLYTIPLNWSLTILLESKIYRRILVDGLSPVRQGFETLEVSHPPARLEPLLQLQMRVIQPSLLSSTLATAGRYSSKFRLLEERKPAIAGCLSSNRTTKIYVCSTHFLAERLYKV